MSIPNLGSLAPPRGKAPAEKATSWEDSDTRKDLLNTIRSTGSSRSSGIPVTRTTFEDLTAKANNMITEGARQAGVALASKKRGGRIPKTGIYKLHAGEFVIPARAAKKISGRKSSRRSRR